MFLKMYGGVKVYTVGVKKSSHLPSVQRDGQYCHIPFLFNYRAVAVLVHFQTVPVLS